MKFRLLWLVTILAVMAGFLSPGPLFSGPSSEFAFSSPIDISMTTGPSEDPVIAVDSAGFFYVVWSDSTRGKFEILYRRCTADPGVNCFPSIPISPALPDPEMNISNTPDADSIDPAIAADGPNVVVVWQDQEEILLKRGEPIKEEFAFFEQALSVSAPDPKILTECQVRLPARSPVVAIGRTGLPVARPGRIFVAWEAGPTYADPEIRFRSSSPFAPILTISERRMVDPRSARAPAITVDKFGTVYVAWQERDPRLNDYEIFFTRSSNAGEDFIVPEFDPPYNFSGPNTPGESEEPAIAADTSGTIFFVWADNTKDDTKNPSNPRNYDIRFKRSTDALSLENISAKIKEGITEGSPGDSRAPDIAVDFQGKVYIVWEESLLGEGKKSDIYFITGRPNPRDGGRTFKFSDLRNISKSSDISSKSPAIAIDRGRVYIVWQEEVDDGKAEIFFAMSEGS